MANPAAPRETHDTTGAKLYYGIALDGANDVAALTRILDVAVVADETTKSGKQAVSLQPTAVQGGLSIGRVLAAATTNATSVKGSAGQLYGWQISNVSAAAKFVKFYDKATAPTVGTDPPVVTIGLPANSTVNLDAANGIAFALGIGLAITGAYTDADTTAVAAGDVLVNLLYK